MLKIGVIGAGHLGKIHIQQLKEISEYSLEGFYDHNDENADQIKGDFDVTKFESVEELIDNVDVVDIVTPTISHYDCAIKALTKSKHVFIEKPVTNTLKEAAELKELVREASVKVQVGHVERFNPAFMAAAPYCSNPMFIETHRLAQFNPRGTDVPVVLDLMIHDIDIVLSVVKSNIKNISASGVSVVSDSPDIANARIEFDNGCVANLTASRISLKNMRKSRFFQKDAYITIDFLDKKVNLVKIQDVNDQTKDDPFAVLIDTGNGGMKKQLYFENPDIEEINSIRLELKSLADAINNKTAPLVSIEDGYNALAVAHTILDKMSMTQKVL
ncbi:MAG: Gfo/Idh/MocA family oxidoreductase [Flavobacteriales bacterium]|nr:Gfo/Idh/MocA family oxidoreductase [Flavobacteriales bacterium]